MQKTLFFWKKALNGSNKANIPVENQIEAHNPNKSIEMSQIQSMTNFSQKIYVQSETITIFAKFINHNLCLPVHVDPFANLEDLKACILDLTAR